MENKNSLYRNIKKNKFSKICEPLKHPLQAIVVGLLIGGVIIAFSGFNPFEAIIGMFKGGFGSAYYLTTTLTRSVPIIFAGLSLGIRIFKFRCCRANGFRGIYISCCSCNMSWTNSICCYNVSFKWGISRSFIFSYFCICK